MEETGYNVHIWLMMIAYLRLLLKLSYKRRRPLSYIVALNVLTMTINALQFLNCMNIV